MTSKIILEPARNESAALHLVQRIQNAGFRAYWVGGCVRDRLMGRIPVDYDIATDAGIEVLASLFPDSIAVGKAFGVTRVLMDGLFFEVAMFRAESHYTDGRRPDQVAPSDPETDACRRDFTVNALFFDPVSGSLYDYVGGRKDIERRVIRCVGNPLKRFAEDHLRMLRAVRFSSTLAFNLDPETADAIRAHAYDITRISAERIRDELTRILIEAPLAGEAIRLMDELGLLKPLLPEISSMKGVQQEPDEHPEGDVFAHTLKALDIMSTDDPILAFAVLLHDVGKPETMTKKNGRIVFPDHSDAGASVATELLRRLRFSNREVSAIADCVRRHDAFFTIRDMNEAELRRFMASGTYQTELELHRIDLLACGGSSDNYDFLVSKSASLGNSNVLPKRWIRGDDLLALGVERGPAVRRFLEEAYDAQLDGRFQNREELLEWLKKHAQLGSMQG